MKKNTVNGIGLFDLCKGVAILVTILYHTRAHWDFTSVPTLDRFFNFWEMTIFFATNEAFFMMAGYNLRKRPTKKMFTMSFKQTVKPYLISAGCVVMFYFLLYTSFFHHVSEAADVALREGIGLLLGLQMERHIGPMVIPSNGVGWFILAFFWAGCICNAVLNHVPKKYVLPVFIAMTYLYWFSSEDWSFFCLLAGAGNALYFYLGYLTKQKKVLEGNLKKYLVIMLALGLAEYGLEFFVPKLWNPITSTNPYFIAFHVRKFWEITLGLFRSLIWACVMILVFVQLNSVKSRILDALCFVGRYTMDIFFVHAVEFAAVPWMVLNWRFSNHVILGCILEGILRCGLIALVCVLLNKYKAFKRNIKNGYTELYMKETVVGSLGMFDLCKGVILLALVFWNIQSHWEFSGNRELRMGLALMYGTLFLGLYQALFLMAGYHLRTRSVKDTASMGLRGTLVPYLSAAGIATVLVFLSRMVMTRSAAHSAVSAMQRAGGLLMGLNNDTALFGILFNSSGVGYFLLAFFWGSCIYCAVRRYVPQKWMLPTLAGLLILSYNVPEEWTVFGLLPGAGAALFFFLGQWMKDKKLLEQKLTAPLITLMIAGFCLFVFEFTYERRGYFQPDAGPRAVVFLLNHIRRTVPNLTLVLIWTVVLVILMVKANAVRSRVLDMVSWLGSHFIEFLFVYTIECAVIPWQILANRAAHHPFRGFILEIPIHFLLTAILFGLALLGKEYWWKLKRNHHF